MADEKIKRVQSLDDYLNDYKDGKHRFENAFQSVSRMILEGDDRFEKKNVNGHPTIDYKFFRESKKPIVGMYDEINAFVSYVQNAAEGGSAKEMAFVLVGEPGNGKTFFVNYVCDGYRQFIAQPQNRKFTFRFKDLD